MKSEKLEKFRSGYQKAADIFSSIMIWLCILVFIAMVFSVSYGVLGRYIKIIKAPRWTQEMAILCLVWLCFIGAGYAIKENLHVRMSVINLIVPEKAGMVLYFLALLLLIFVNLFWIVYGVKMVGLTKTAKMAATGWPMSITYVSLVIGGLYGFVMALGRIIKGDF